MTQPAWVQALSQRVEVLQSQRLVGDEIGYSAAVVNQVLKGTYKGNLNKVQAAVEGVLLKREVDCPVIGMLARHLCLHYQQQPLVATNPTNVQMYRACKSCPNSIIAGAAGKENAS